MTGWIRKCLDNVDTFHHYQKEKFSGLFTSLQSTLTNTLQSLRLSSPLKSNRQTQQHEYNHMMVGTTYVLLNPKSHIALA
jgi:hypothetical protein